MMKLYPVTLSLLLIALADSTIAENPTGCVSGDEAEKFMFEHQVEVVESEHWSISYEGNYKVLKNIAADEAYLLYQCGTDPPSTDDGTEYTAIVPIPLDSVGLHYTTMIPFLEILGARMNIGAFFGEASWVSSSCVTELLDEEPSSIETVPDPTNSTLITNVPLDFPSFIGQYANLAFNQTFRIGLSEEDYNLAAFEWIKFYSVFFNLEEKANEIFNDVKERYECTEQNAAIMLCEEEKEKPVVLWGYYSAFCGGWDVAECPNYYCELAQSCSATILNSTEGSYFSDLCGTNYMNTTEFVEFGKDADIWIYPSPDFENTLSQFPELEDFVSVKSQEVYDNQGRVGWFEQRLAEPDVLLQDFCGVVGLENPAAPHPRAWFRNVYTEPTGTIGECEDPNEALIPPSTECVVIVTSDACAENNDSSASNAFLPFVIAALVASISVALTW